MSTMFWQFFLKVSPAILGMSLFVASRSDATQTAPSELALAQTTQLSPAIELSNLESTEVSPLGQLSPIPSDITPNSHHEISEVSSLVELSPTASDITANSSREILEQIEIYNSENTTTSLEQVTNVGQLRDVSPGDWAYEALRSLVERYGCIAGYPDGTYRGNRAMTRYEFAAGLNSCLNQIERLIGTSPPPEGDLETLRRLIQEFEVELATLGARVDNLESRTAFLEDNQFSTTTKLTGEAIFTLAGAFGDEKARPLPDSPATNQDIDDNITLSNRARLNLDTSFMGRDRLRTRLQAGNFVSLAGATGTDMARLGHDAGGGNDLIIDDLNYRFPLGNNLRVWIGANAFDLDKMTTVHNPILASGGTGALSRFLRRNPAVFRNSVSQGAGVNIRLSNALGLDLGYFAGNGDNPAPKNGLFDGAFTATAQLNATLGQTWNVGLTYGYSYYPGTTVNLSGSTGSPLARRPFGAVATSAHRFGLQSSLRVAPRINLAGWGGLVLANAESSPRQGDNATLWNWAANVSFLDVGKEGAAFSIAGGMPPKATRVDGGPQDRNTSWIVEAQYQYPLSDNILITPGAYVIFNPNHNNENDTIWVGVLRTTFRF